MNPLLEALKPFCDERQLKTLLLQPETVKPKPQKVSSAFEHHVAWLLNLLGFPAIALGEYEMLRPAGTKIDQASVDILAVNRNKSTVLAVSCTLGVLKTEDYTNLLHACAILRDEVFKSTAIQVIPMLFTAARDHPAEFPSPSESIVVFDANRMQQLLRLLLERKENEAVALLLPLR